MKIGHSLSRCVLDIAEGRVDLEDVMILITGTHFDPTLDDQWDNIWAGYAYEERAVWGGLRHMEDGVRAIVLQLWHDGKIHQPRKFGSQPHRARHHWREVILVDEELELNLTAKKAWEQYQIVAGLSNIKVIKE